MILKRKKIIIISLILSISTFCSYLTIKSFNETPSQNTFALSTKINGELNNNSEVEIKVTFENKSFGNYLVTSSPNIINIIFQEKINDEYEEIGFILIGKSHFISSRKKISFASKYFLEEDKQYRFIATASIYTGGSDNKINLLYRNAYEFSNGNKSNI